MTHMRSLSVLHRFRVPLRTWALLLLLLVGTAQAQDPRAGGRRFRIHTVEAGQTLYAISRAYAVPVEALLEANPDAKNGLSIGQELRIPQDAVVKKDVKTAPVLQGDGELLHTVAKKETLFGIARQYGVDVNALLARNPEAAEGLREGNTLVIPAGMGGGSDPAALQAAAPERVVDHVVKPGETLYSLGKLYQVAPERIQAANGGLPDGLKAGMTIRVPLAANAEPPVQPEPGPVLRDRYTVCLLLPFALDRNDSLKNVGNTNGSWYEPTRIAAQFYAGARIALDSLRALGLNADVLVVDVGDDARTWEAALKRNDLRDVDLFIGPFHRSAIERVIALNPRAHVVCPVPQSNKVILGNPTVSKVNTGRTDLLRYTARYVAQRHGRENVILLKPDIHGDKEMQEQMQRWLSEALANVPGRTDTLLSARPGRRDLGDLPGKLRSDRLNVLVAPSEDVEFLTTLVTKLRSTKADKRVQVVGLESWLEMETLAIADLDQLAFTYASAVFTDPADPQVQAFDHEFTKRFQNQADEYGLLGFDVTFQYGLALMRFGPRFPDRLGEVRTEPLHMGFRMGRTGPENGLRNEHGVMLQLKDLQVVKAP